MARFVILIAYGAGPAWETLTEAQQQAFYDAHAAFEAYVDEHGEQHGSAALADADRATTLRRDGDSWRVTEGPYVETAEWIGGYYDVELPGLDAAVEAAGLLHPSYTLEIRPTVRIT